MILTVACNSRILTELCREIEAGDVRPNERTHPLPGCPLQEVSRGTSHRGRPLACTVPLGSPYYKPLFLARTEAGISQWAVEYRPRIYGEDVGLFRQRWTGDRFAAGYGGVLRPGGSLVQPRPMMCTGRKTAVLEVCKVVTQFSRMFDVKAMNTTKPPGR